MFRCIQPVPHACGAIPPCFRKFTFPPTLTALLQPCRAGTAQSLSACPLIRPAIDTKPHYRWHCAACSSHGPDPYSSRQTRKRTSSGKGILNAVHGARAQDVRFEDLGRGAVRLPGPPWRNKVVRRPADVPKMLPTHPFRGLVSSFGIEWLCCAM